VNPIYERVSPEEIFIDERELWARLGGVGAVDDGKIKSVVAEISSAMSAAFVADELMVAVNNGACISTDRITVASANFAKIAGGCHRVIAVAATLGAGVDYLIRKKSAISVAEGFIFDAVASAMVEGLVNLATVRLTLGREHTGRFSPGYGDMPLDIQGDIIALLDAGRRLGLTLGETKLMSPQKSVTALIGIK
jgi:hypothetical protein